MVLFADDVHLVRAAQAHDVHAFEVLIRRHEGAVYRVALRMLGNPQDAEDAAQDALIQAWRALPSFRGASAFSSWLYRIVTNRCLTLLAGRRAVVPLEDDRPDSRPGPEATVEAEEGFEELKTAIMALTPEQRAPLVLREFEGLSYEEIGEVLDLSAGAVKGRLHRGRRELVEEMRAWR